MVQSEKAFKRKIGKLGYKVVKLDTWASTVGLPDFLIVKEDKVHLVEVKWSKDAAEPRPSLFTEHQTNFISKYYKVVYIAFLDRYDCWNYYWFKKDEDGHLWFYRLILKDNQFYKSEMRVTVFVKAKD